MDLSLGDGRRFHTKPNAPPADFQRRWNSERQYHVSAAHMSARETEHDRNVQIFENSQDDLLQRVILSAG